MTTAPTFDLIVTGGTLVNHAGRTQTDIGIRGGRFVAFGDLSTAKSAARFDARGLTVLPGVIDTQVHMREPGLRSVLHYGRKVIVFVRAQQI